MTSLDCEFEPIAPQDFPSSSSPILAHAANRLDVPRAGYVLSTVAESLGKPLRDAMAILRDSLDLDEVSKTWGELYASRRTEPGAASEHSVATLGAWSMVAIWVVGVASESISKFASLEAAESWFIGGLAKSGLVGLTSADAQQRAEKVLHECADSRAFSELLPYILDPHGEGSRLSVRRRPETASARQTKKSSGVFYTPADVATYMVKQALAEVRDGVTPLTVFDPACGSGVFLRATIRELLAGRSAIDTFDVACTSLFGADTDSWAVNASAFVILFECLPSLRRRKIPMIGAWHALRMNLVHVDALRVDPGTSREASDPDRLARLKCRSLLKAGHLPRTSGGSYATGVISFDKLFAEIAEGPCLLVGNPPYADIGSGCDLSSLTKRFETLKAAPKETSDLYPLFVEQMIRLSAPNAHGGAMVLPLSVACGTNRQFIALRSLFSKTPGVWRFSFFDREPHALFGEDVKTRNAIVLWSRRSGDTRVTIQTGPLRKWRGSGRAEMFGNIAYTPLSVDIRPGIPKIEGALQAATFARLIEGERQLRHEVIDVGRATLADALDSDDKSVFVASTAYNFLNAFLRPEIPRHLKAPSLTENPLHAITCGSKQAALQVLAILNSRYAYWWWHANGDGFHVSKYIVESLPVGKAFRSGCIADRLAALGGVLWSRMRDETIVSVNKGRLSLGYSSANQPVRDQIDEALGDALSAEPAFTENLRRFCSDMASARQRTMSSKNNGIHSNDV